MEEVSKWNEERGVAGRARSALFNKLKLCTTKLRYKNYIYY